MSPNEFKTRLAELEKQISDLKNEYYGNTSSTSKGGGVCIQSSTRTFFSDDRDFLTKYSLKSDNLYTRSAYNGYGWYFTSAKLLVEQDNKQSNCYYFYITDQWGHSEGSSEATKNNTSLGFYPIFSYDNY